MIPILNKRCPKCGYLTLCECNNNIYCLCSNGCDYTNKKLITKNIQKINYQNDYTQQKITDIIIEYLEDT